MSNFDFKVKFYMKNLFTIPKKSLKNRWLGQQLIDIFSSIFDAQKTKQTKCFNKGFSRASKGQIKLKAGLARHRFSQKTNARISFVCCENSFVRFLGESTTHQSAFSFI